MPKSPSEPVPLSQAGRIRWVAEHLYGSDSGWRVHIARELGIGRSTLYRYLARKRTVPGIDDALALLLARQRIASHSRGRAIARAERTFTTALGRRPVASITTTAKD